MLYELKAFYKSFSVSFIDFDITKKEIKLFTRAIIKTGEENSKVHRKYKDEREKTKGNFFPLKSY